MEDQKMDETFFDKLMQQFLEDQEDAEEYPDSESMGFLDQSTKGDEEEQLPVESPCKEKPLKEEERIGELPERGEKKAKSTRRVERSGGSCGEDEKKRRSSGRVQKSEESFGGEDKKRKLSGRAAKKVPLGRVARNGEPSKGKSERIRRKARNEESSWKDEKKECIEVKLELEDLSGDLEADVNRKSERVKTDEKCSLPEKAGNTTGDKKTLSKARSKSQTIKKYTVSRKARKGETSQGETVEQAPEASPRVTPSLQPSPDPVSTPSPARSLPFKKRVKCGLLDSSASSEGTEASPSPELATSTSRVPARFLTIRKDLTSVPSAQSFTDPRFTQSTMSEAEGEIPCKIPRLELSERDLPYQSYRCQDCGDEFLFWDCFLEHIGRRTSKISVNCQACNKECNFTNLCQLQSHLRLNGTVADPIIVDMKSLSPSEIIKSFCKSPEPSPTSSCASPSCTVSLPTSGTCSNQVSESPVQVLKSPVQGSESESDCAVEENACEGDMCSECNVFFPSLSDHLLNNNKPSNPLLFCKMCSFVLPTICSWKMHIRVHLMKRPHCCPDCGQIFEPFEELQVHLREECFHFNKLIRYHCAICGLLLFSAETFRNHIMSLHDTLIYKCLVCPHVSNHLKEAAKHAATQHPGSKLRAPLFHKCPFCPDVVSPKGKYAKHLSSHISDISSLVYIYKCNSCGFITVSKAHFMVHRKSICSPIIPRQLPEASSKPESESKPEPERILERKDPVKRQLFANNKPPRSTFVKKSVPEKATDPTRNIYKCLLCKLLLNYNADEVARHFSVCHNIFDPNSYSKYFITTNFTNEKRDREKSESNSSVEVSKVSSSGVQPGVRSSQPLIRGSQSSVKIPQPLVKKPPPTISISQSLVRNSKPLVKNPQMPVSISQSPVNIAKPSLDVSKPSVNSSQQSIDVSEPFKVPEPVSENSLYRKKRYRTIPISPPKGSRDSQILRRPCQPIRIKTVKKKKNRTKPKSRPMTGMIIEKPFVLQPPFKCMACDFVGGDVEEYRNHVAVHRTEREAFQCLDCMECFVTKASLERHLIAIHSIFDTESYIDSYNVCHKLFETRQPLLQHQCSVCKAILDSNLSLSRHMRTHGMAFLNLMMPSAS